MSRTTATVPVYHCRGRQCKDRHVLISVHQRPLHHRPELVEHNLSQNIRICFTTYLYTRDHYILGQSGLPEGRTGDAHDDTACFYRTAVPFLDETTYKWSGLSPKT